MGRESMERTLRTKDKGSQPANKVFSDANNPKALYQLVKKGQTRKLGCRYTPDELRSEIADYFEFCFTERLTPGVASLSTWLGVHRDTLHDWETTNRGGLSALVKDAKQVILAIQETSVMNGTIPPIPFIFLSKNYHGMHDKQDVTITPGAQQGLSDSEVDGVIDALPDPNIIDIN